MSWRLPRPTSTLATVALCLACSEDPEPPAEPEPRAGAELDHGADPAPGPDPGLRPDPGPGTASPPDARTRLVLLGTGTPEADPERSGPALAVVVDDHAYLVDAGPGVVRRAAAAANDAEPALDTDRLGRVFLTHLHSDHTLGLPSLILGPWVLGRAEPLTVHGPPGTEAMVEHLLEAWREDVAIRTEGLERASPDGWRATVREVEPGLAYEDERVRVRAFAVDHGSWSHAFGYRFEGPDRVIVVSGDTRPTDAVVEACDGCDLLVHEVYALARFGELPEPVQRYHRAFHTSSAELAELATRARPERLVLYHHLLWGAAPERLLEELREAGYEGEVRFGRDLDVL